MYAFSTGYRMRCRRHEYCCQSLGATTLREGRRCEAVAMVKLRGVLQTPRRPSRAWAVPAGNLGLSDILGHAGTQEGEVYKGEVGEGEDQEHRSVEDPAGGDGQRERAGYPVGYLSCPRPLSLSRINMAGIL